MSLTCVVEDSVAITTPVTSNAMSPIPVPRLRALSSTSSSTILDTFFTHIHAFEMNDFIHQGDLMRDHVEGQIPSLLMQSIHLVSGRFLPSADTSNPDGGEGLAKLAIEIKMSLMADTDKYSLTKLAALLLVIFHETCSGRHGSSWLLISLAARMSFAMGLNVETEGLSWKEAEFRRRLMWSAFAIDSQSAGGITEYLLIDRKNLRIALPSSERSYAINNPILGPTLDDIEFNGSIRSDDGLFQRFIRLIALRNDILG